MLSSEFEVKNDQSEVAYCHHEIRGYRVAYEVVTQLMGDLTWRYACCSNHGKYLQG